MDQRFSEKPALHGVRAVAIGMVMAVHALSAYAPGGFLGVDVFFVLSAFLITSLVYVELASSDGDYRFRAFYWRRAIRLGPALLVWLVLLAAPTAILDDQADRIPLSTLASLFYFGDFVVAFSSGMADAYAHVWSLAVEEQFYILWPIVIVLAYRGTSAALRRKLLLGLLIASVLLYVAAEIKIFGGARNYFLPSGHIVPLSAGVLAADLLHDQPGWLDRLRSAPVLWAIACAGYTLGSDHLSTETYRMAALIVVSLLTAATAIDISRRPSLVARWLSRSPLLWLGKRSYGLYLYHRTLGELLPHLVPGIRNLVAAPIVLLLSFVLAEMSWRLVERPVQVWGRRRQAERQVA